jgi:alpha-D-ribose 1-methylphosphonate 5-triphosphate diphosphatase
MDMQLLIQGGICLVQQEENQTEWNETAIMLHGAHIGHIGATTNLTGSSACPTFDASGLLVLPGMVDIHGDAFERQIQPRPGTSFSHEIALADTDRQLITNGITTACHGVTYSWEGGLRGRDAALALMDQVALQRKHSQADHRIHLRFENHHAEGLNDALDWIAQDRIDFFAFNEHLPAIAKKCLHPEKVAAYAERARCDVATFQNRLHNAQARFADVANTVTQLAAACRSKHIPMASHDDESRSDREHYQAFGATISEFPRTQEALLTSMAMGNKVVMGAPNVLLGGSHCGSLSAAESVRSGLCHILASDYYYPSLLHAPFMLEHESVCSLPEAWKLVSSNPAAVLGLGDRGRIAEGCRADLVLIERQEAGRVRLVATIAAGKLVYCAQPGRLMAQPAYALAA